MVAGAESSDADVPNTLETVEHDIERFIGTLNEAKQTVASPYHRVQAPSRLTASACRPCPWTATYTMRAPTVVHRHRSTSPRWDTGTH